MSRIQYSGFGLGVGGVVDVEQYGASHIEAIKSGYAWADVGGQAVEPRFITVYLSGNETLDLYYADNLGLYSEHEVSSEVDNDRIQQGDFELEIGADSDVELHYANSIDSIVSSIVFVDMDILLYFRAFLKAFVGGVYSVDMYGATNISVEEEKAVETAVGNDRIHIGVIASEVSGVYDTDIYYVENIDVIKERYVDVNIGSDFFTKNYITVEVVGEVLADVYYAGNETLEEVGGISAEVEHDVWAIKDVGIASEVVGDITLDVYYAESRDIAVDGIIEVDYQEIKTRVVNLGSRVVSANLDLDVYYADNQSIAKVGVVEPTIDTEVELWLLNPVVTLVADVYCREITLRVTNPNDIIVRAYADNVELGFIREGGRTKDYTFSHNLNGDMWATPGYFIKDFKFTNQARTKQSGVVRYQRWIGTSCTPK